MKKYRVLQVTPSRVRQSANYIIGVYGEGKDHEGLVDL